MVVTFPASYVALAVRLRALVVPWDPTSLESEKQPSTRPVATALKQTSSQN
jgi:hypothetical protein